MTPLPIPTALAQMRNAEPRRARRQARVHSLNYDGQNTRRLVEWKEPQHDTIETTKTFVSDITEQSSHTEVIQPFKV